MTTERLRALEKKWRDGANGAEGYSVTNYDAGYIAGARRCADELATLIAELWQEVGAVDEDAQDVPVWTLLGLAEQCGAVRDSDDNSTWWTLGLDAAYKLEELLRAHGVSAGWASSPAHTSEARDASSILTWAVERWHAEVAQRSLVNVHRRSLDDCWRQVVRRCGEDDVVLLGPRHDDLVAAMRQEGGNV